MIGYFVEIFLPQPGRYPDVRDGRHGALRPGDRLADVRLRAADAGLARFQLHIPGHPVLWSADIAH